MDRLEKPVPGGTHLVFLLVVFSGLAFTSVAIDSLVSLIR